MLREDVVGTPEKLVDLGRLLCGACDVLGAGKAGVFLYGLSPGIRRGGPLRAFDGRCGISLTEKLWVSLDDGPWGRSMILRDAICWEEARFTGLFGAATACAFPFAFAFRLRFAVVLDNDASVFLSRLSAGVEELRKSPPRLKRPRFLVVGGSMMMLWMGGRIEETRTRFDD
jgi:hypothetical protein